MGSYEQRMTDGLLKRKVGRPAKGPLSTIDRWRMWSMMAFKLMVKEEHPAEIAKWAYRQYGKRYSVEQITRWAERTLPKP